MMNNSIADYLHELVRFRNNEQVQKEEFNCFTESDQLEYQSRTDKIYKLACEYDEKNYEQQQRIQPMTLDEAIAHANEVADAEECEQCASEHKQLADWLSELKDIKNRYAYLAADFDNYKKRMLKNEQLICDKAYEDVIVRFLNVYDDMEKLCNEVRRGEKDVDELNAKSANLGYELIFENLEKTLNMLGCQKIDVKQGDEFDVNHMEAISTRKLAENESSDDDVVVEIFSVGWKRNGRVIKPTKVITGK